MAQDLQPPYHRCLVLYLLPLLFYNLLLPGAIHNFSHQLKQKQKAQYPDKNFSITTFLLASPNFALCIINSNSANASR